MAEALNRAGGGAPRFVPQAELPAGEAYETFIARTGCVPTRDNLHDGYNGLVWLTQPALKTRLNALHAAAIAREGIGPRRSALRDALTLFDEFGAWIEVPAAAGGTPGHATADTTRDDVRAAFSDALRRRDWQDLFVVHRARWCDATVHLVGHALLEQLAVAPRKGLTAHVIVGHPLALDEAAWAAKPFDPLPVLGIPGWWPANQDPAFYDDAAVFRPPMSLRDLGPAAPVA